MAIEEVVASTVALLMQLHIPETLKVTDHFCRNETFTFLYELFLSFCNKVNIQTSY